MFIGGQGVDGKEGRGLGGNDMSQGQEIAKEVDH